jgi:acyl-CoA thioesterase FadM
MREAEATLLASGSTKHACVDGQGRIMRIEEELMKALEIMLCPPDETA